jgi:hypothetical protein
MNEVYVSQVVVQSNALSSRGHMRPQENGDESRQ